MLISAIPPTFMKSERHPDGLPKEVVDSTAMLPRNTAHSFIMTYLVYGFNRRARQGVLSLSET